jgi:hypothetical protein
MLTVLAVIAPVSLAGPKAVAHCPTTRAADVAEMLFVKVVFDVKATFDISVLVLSLLEVGFFVDLLPEPLDDLVGRTGTVPTTTKAEPEIEVTLPNALEKVRAAAPPRNAPAGIDPRVNEPLGGRNPPEPAAPAAPPPAPPKPAPPPNPPPPVHDPLVLGWVIDTVVAVKWVDDDLVDLVDELLVAVTQSPTASSEEGKVTVWVKFVEAVQVTVTWPLEGFCTSIEVPGTTAAIVPDAVEKAGLGIVVVVEVFFFGVVAAPADPPTTATLVTRARPSPNVTNLQRNADRATCARGTLEPAPIKSSM